MSDAGRPDPVIDSTGWTGEIEERYPVPPNYRPPGSQLEDGARATRLLAIAGALIGSEVVFALLTRSAHTTYGFVNPMSDSPLGFWLHVGFLVLCFAGFIALAIASWIIYRKKSRG